MWEWFTGYSLWILVAAAFILTLLLFLRHRVQTRLEKAAPKKWYKRVHRTLSITFWTVGGIILAFIVTAIVAFTLSRQGIAAVITVETIQKWLLEHGITILIIVVVSYLVYRLLGLAMPGLVERTIKVRGKGRRAREEQAKRTSTLSGMLTSAVGIIIAVAAILMILSEVEIDITPLLAGAGIIGIALGFGAQSLVRDLLAGLFIILEDQYSKGDWVEIAGVNGLVEEINLRRTVLRDLEGAVHTIPNGEVRIATDFTKEWARVNLIVPVAYGEDLDHVTEVINRVGEELFQDETFGPMITKAPQVLRVNNFGDSGIDMKVLGETKPMQQWAVTGELRKRVKKAFDEEGIEIPWPHVKLYFGKSQTNEVSVCKACSHPNRADSKFCSNCGATLNQ